MARVESGVELLVEVWSDTFQCWCEGLYVGMHEGAMMVEFRYGDHCCRKAVRNLENIRTITVDEEKDPEMLCNSASVSANLKFQRFNTSVHSTNNCGNTFNNNFNVVTLKTDETDDASLSQTVVQPQRDQKAAQSDSIASRRDVQAKIVTSSGRGKEPHVRRFDNISDAKAAWEKNTSLRAATLYTRSYVYGNWVCAAQYPGPFGQGIGGGGALSAIDCAAELDSTRRHSLQQLNRDGFGMLP